ncbi:MAG: hypothetical protein Q8N23_24725 [Archangium sp.]|nr:hypothetical protein [Archangium sp.]MDP3574412.1 hypothetical protein [Archangium sp.]
MTKSLLLAVLTLPGFVLAQVSPTCDLPRDIDKYQLLRRLSLDLRGKVPTYEEYAALDTQTTVTPATVQSWLTSDDFRIAMRRYHEELFWPNVSNVALAGTNAQLTLLATPAAWTIASTGKRRLFRGASDVNTAIGAQCGDFEQTQFTTGFVPATAGIRTSVVAGVTVKQEGWRMVTPYWSTTPIKVCAFDAMETERVTVSGKVIECNSIESDARVECGCGPDLKYCYGPTANVRTVIENAMREQLNLMVDRVTTGGQPYTDLVTSRTAPVNGPLVFWKKNLAPHLTYARIVSLPDPNEPLTGDDFADTTWRQVDRGSALHAGVLTSAAYLLRFQTNRGRANRARIDFECESFVPPSQLETPAQGCSDSSDDLTQRCTCRYCHRQLEPLAAGFGPFSEAGTTLMTDLVMFPRTKASCVNSNSAFCKRFYITEDSADNAGALIPWQYANAAHPEITTALAAGPKGRANAIIADGTFARCAVKRTWSYFMKRDMRLIGTDPDEAATLQTLTTQFQSNGYRLPWLVEQIVSQPGYRRVR